MNINQKIPAVGEFGVALLVIAIISLIILPLPPAVIDMLLGINIAISVSLLMITMFIPDVVSLSAFPSLLLFTTLYRLSLNIASTKSILLHADAGHIIESFGKLVVGGNLVVGLVVFTIISTVQFIVIAKGSERVAEVGARFTLDALPGKQMSIDADLRANLISSDEARRKRAALAIESRLHGGMDGAMKFVKGDAIAGLVITLINIVAGIAVGILYHNMAAGEAANRFCVLSVGDAMVSQVPSLLLSVAAGIMITRGGDERRDQSSLGEEIGRQLGSNERALYFAAALLLGFAIVPGFPALLFILLSAILAAVAYRLQSNRARKSAFSGDPSTNVSASGVNVESVIVLPHAPQFTCPLSARLAPGVLAQLSIPALDQALALARQQLQETLGLPFPGLTIWTSPALPPETCELLVHDVPQQRLAVHAGKAMDGGQSVEEVIANTSAEILRRHAAQFLGIQEVQSMLERFSRSYPGLVAEVQKVLSPYRIADVLRRLLEEQISIRDLRSIIESLVAWAPKEKDMLLLTEYVRGDLSRLLSHRATGGKQELLAICLDTSLEQHIRQSIRQTPAGNYVALPPDELGEIIAKIEALAGVTPRDDVAVVASMDVRRYIRRIVEARLDWLAVYSYQELGKHVQLRSIGHVSI
jgi:type III secretion protein V